MNGNEIYNTPSSNLIVEKPNGRFLITLSRILSILCIVFWFVVILFSFVKSFDLNEFEIAYALGSIIGTALLILIMFLPLYLYIRISGKTEKGSRKKTIVFNTISAILVCALFLIIPFYEKSEFGGINIICSIIFACPYILNVIAVFHLPNETGS